MKFLLDIPDTEQSSKFLQRMRTMKYVQKIERVTSADIDLLQELFEVKQAHRLAQQVKTGKLKTRSAKALLDEL